MPCEIIVVDADFVDDITLAFPFDPGSLTGTDNGYAIDPGDLDAQDPNARTFTLVASTGLRHILEFCYDLQTTPTPGIWFDLARDGFAGADDLTLDVMSISWTRGGTADLVGGVQPGSATIVLRNTDGKYSPDNPASVFYGNRPLGMPVWAGINDDGTVGPGYTGGFLLLETGDNLLLETGDALLLES
jgi:hypothetical protein